MTSPLTYTIGTVTLEHGSAEIEGNGTSWQLSGVRGGVMTVEAAGGNPLVLDTVEDDTTATAATKWMGPSGTYNYAISLASADAAETVWASRHWSRVVGGALLAGIVPAASGTLAQRDALVPMIDDDEWFARAEAPYDLELYRKVPGGWDGPYFARGQRGLRGAPGLGSGGYGLPLGGEQGQMLIKASNADGEAEWGPVAVGYDEGTFTPGFSFATPGDLSVNYNFRTGSYTRIGRRIFFEAIVYATPIFSTASGATRITGLPFDVSSNYDIGQPVAGFPIAGQMSHHSSVPGGGGAVVGFSPRLTSGADYMTLTTMGQSGNIGYFTPDNFASGAGIRFTASGSYEIDE